VTSYRKKPVVIEAWKLPEHASDELMPDWATSAYEEGNFGKHEGSSTYWIRTLEGTMQAQIGDWLIKGIVGELHACKSAIFEATYEAID
jgi:hypothetical protein